MRRARRWSRLSLDDEIPWELRINAGRPKAYRIDCVGDVIGSKAMRSEEFAALAGDIKPVDLGPVHHDAHGHEGLWASCER